MLVRIWKVGIAPNKSMALEEFAQTISLPMFQAQPGCLGVLFTRSDTDCATITLWDSERSVQALEESERYRQVVTEIETSGILRDNHQIDVYPVYGGFASVDLASQLSALD